MAVTVTPNLTDVTLGEAADDGYWTGSDGYSTEVFRQGSASQGWIVAKNTNETATFDYYSKATATLDMSGTGVHLLITMKCDIAPFIDYIHFGLYSDTAHGAATTGNKWWTVVDNTTNVEWTGGWLTIRLDVNSTSTFSSSGTLDLSAIDTVGINVDNSNSGNIRSIENTYIDTIRFGTGLTLTGTAWDWADVAAIDSNDTYKYDIVVPNGSGTFNVYGQLQIGNGATTTTPASTNEELIFQDISTAGDKGGPIGKQASGFYQVLVTGSGCTCDFDNLSIKGTSNAPFIFDADDTALPDDSIDWNGGTVLQCSSFLSDGAQAFANMGFYNCGQIVPGASDFTGCIIDGYTGTDGALLWPSTSNVSDCSFSNNDRAIEHQSAGTVAYDGMVFSGNTYDISFDGAATQVDTYASGNQDADVNLDASPTAVGQTFTATAGVLSRARFWMKSSGSPTGNAVAKLYATSGGAPTGSALATSENLDASTVGATYGWEEFEFKDQYTLVASTVYAIVVEYTGTASDYLIVGVDNSSPSHAGTAYDYVSGWTSQSYDVIFELNRDGILIINGSNGSNASSYELTASTDGTVIISNPVTHTVTGLDAGSQVIWIRQSDDEELENKAAVAGEASYAYNYVSDTDVYVQILDLNKLNKVYDITLGDTDESLPAAQSDDNVYSNP